MPDVICTRTVNIKLWVVKDVDNSFGAARVEVCAGRRVALNIEILQRAQAVLYAQFQVKLQVKVWVSVFLVDTATLIDDFLDFCATNC